MDNFFFIRTIWMVILMAGMVFPGTGSFAAGSGIAESSPVEDSREEAPAEGSREEAPAGAESDAHADAKSATFNTATYNIRLYNPSDAPNTWEQRRAHLANLIRFHDIAIWGSQEGKHNQLQYLQNDLDYEYVGVARDDGDTEGEYSAIMYDPERFRAVDNGTFWLSETPDRPSMAWGANHRRICTWGLFEHRESGITFYLYNAHFDHQSQEARENSSRMILEHIDEHVDPEAPLLFMGDLNAGPDNPAYSMAEEHDRLADAYHLTNTPPHGPPGTFNGYDTTNDPDRRIDHIFTSGHFEVHRYGVLTDIYEGPRYPSDHFPVMIETTLRP